MEEKIIGSSANRLKKKVSATKEIIYAVHNLILKKYGMNNYGSCENPLEFHNLNHTMTMTFAIDLIYREALRRDKLMDSDIIYLQLAGNCHDVEQMAKDKNGLVTKASTAIIQRHNIAESDVTNELISSLIAREEMIKFGNVFSEEEIQLVEKLILGTRPYFENGKFCQTAGNGSYLEKIVADADLSHLGADTKIFLKNFERYIDEIYKDKTKPKRWEIYNDEINFLQNHEYLTEEANEIFNNKQANIDFCQEKIHRCHKFR